MTCKARIHGVTGNIIHFPALNNISFLSRIAAVRMHKLEKRVGAKYCARGVLRAASSVPSGRQVMIRAYSLVLE